MSPSRLRRLTAGARLRSHDSRDHAPERRPDAGPSAGTTAGGSGDGRRPGTGRSIEQAGEQRSARIESLRALAALAVLFGHIVAMSLGRQQQLAGGVPDADPLERLLFGGGLGVFFFFALTGYLLFWPFARRHFGGGQPIDLRRYGFNRAVRILPLYLVVVLVVLILHDGGATAGVWLRYLTMTINFNEATAGAVTGLGPLWSIIVEVHFYLLLPLLAWGIGRLSSGSMRRAATLLLLVAAASLAVRLATLTLPEGDNPLWRLNLPATFLFFVPGMLLALMRLQWQHGVPTWLRGPLARSDAWILASLPVWAMPIFVSYAWVPAVGVAAFLTVGACVLPLRASPLVRALEWRVLALLGVASYSLYVWHVPVLQTVADFGVGIATWTAFAIPTVPLAILVAFASYRFVESPFLRLREQWSASAADKHERIEARPAPAPAEGSP